MKFTARDFFLALAMGGALFSGECESMVAADIHTVGEFRYEIMDNLGEDAKDAWLIGLADGYVPKGDICIPAVVAIDGMEIKVVGIGHDAGGNETASCPVFQDYPEITSVTIGENIRKIGYNEFFGCESIESYAVAEKNRWFSSTDGLLLETSSGYINLLRYPSARTDRGWTVHPYIATVLEGAFAANRSLSTLYLSPKTTLAPCWQAGNASIKLIGASQSEIYDRERSIDGAIYIKLDHGTGGGYKLVSYCPGASWYTITFPADVEEIAEGAFCYSDVKNIEFGERIDYIPERAFQNSRIETVKLPGLKTGIGQCAFENCANFKRINIPGSQDGNEIFEIGRRAFYNCIAMDTLSAGKPISRISIGEEAFKGCESLKLFKLSAIPTKFSIVGSRAFEGCKEFHSFPVLYIERFEDGAEDVFAGSGLMTMIWTPSVLAVPSGCFRDCRRLKEVYMQSKAQKIGTDAFKGTAVIEFDSENLQSIAEGAFFDTPGLNLIYISDASNRLILSGRFGFENPECKLIVDNKRLLAQSVEGDYSEYSNVALYISALSSFLPSDEWRELYVPAYAAGAYKEYSEHPLEMFSIQILSSGGRIRVAPELEEVEIKNVMIGGVDAIRGEENVWSSAIYNPEPTRMDVLIQYSVLGKDLSTEYLDFLPIDVSSVVGMNETISDFRKTGPEEYEWNGVAKWRLFSISGAYIGSGRGESISLLNLPEGVYILEIPGRPLLKILR